MPDLDIGQKSDSRLFPFSSPSLSCYSKGRYALVDALRQIHRRRRGRLLLPSYICRSVTDTLSREGFSYAYYPVTRKATVRLDILEPRLDESVSAVLFVNYFGFPQPVSRLLDMCRVREIPVIEDNAHGFLGEDEKGRPLGSRGDIGIFSYPKTIYLPDGGGMTVNDPGRFDRFGWERSNEVADGFHGAFLIKRQFLRSMDRVGLDPRVVTRWKRGNRKPGNGAERENRGISAVSRHILARVDRRTVIDFRLRNYRRVVEICDEEGLKPLFNELTDRICPYLVPIVAPENERRKAAENRLRSQGWKISYWPDLPPDLDLDRYGEARWLRENIMAVYLRPAVF